MGKSIRTFVAFELPPDVIAFAAALQARMKAYGLRLRWVSPRNIHLTLKFLGEIAPDLISSVAAAVKAAARTAPPMELAVQGMGIFPGVRRPRVVWIGLGGETERLGQVHADLEKGLAAIGFQRESRPLRAHLTLARINQAVDGRQLLEMIQAESRFAPIAFRASEMVLFQSQLKPHGPIYTPLARVALGQ